MRGLPVFALLLVACSSPAAPPAAPSDSTDARSRDHAERARESEPPVRALPPAVLPAPERLVAIGDVHGDVEAFRAALRLADAVDLADHWIGGALVVVQTGDILDRGDDEPEILALVSRLEQEAEAAGGHFVALNGNHEFMNGQGDFRYVTPEGFTDFTSYRRRASRELRAEFPAQALGRAAAFAPGGRFARDFAGRNTVTVIGDTVFVHGGLAPDYADDGLDTINHAARAYFLGESPIARVLTAEDGPVWNRQFALDASPETCAALTTALGSVHARRMVIGHTVQEQGINGACDDRVFRIDVGLAHHYGGPLEILEIRGDVVRVLRGQR